MSPQVKVDGKTQTLLDEHRAKKRAQKPRGEGEGESVEEGETDDDLDEATVREDRVARAGLDAIVREYQNELMKEPAGKRGKCRLLLFAACSVCQPSTVSGSRQSHQAC